MKIVRQRILFGSKALFTASVKEKQGQDNNLLHCCQWSHSHSSQPWGGMAGEACACGGVQAQLCCPQAAEALGPSGEVSMAQAGQGQLHLWLVVRPQHQAELWPQATALPGAPTMRLSLQVAQLQVEGERGEQLSTAQEETGTAHWRLRGCHVAGAMCLQLCVLLEVTIWMARKSHLHPNGELDKPQQE